jgi:pyruvate/2-oxoglutarate dehydrogenase complex dihydrolipoamide dehydrogenase (E3) component
LTGPRIVILGGGPAGYEAALVAAELGAEVTVVEQAGVGGACVLTDCVPSKTLIATSGQLSGLAGMAGLGVDLAGAAARVDLPAVNARVKALAGAQSRDIATRLAAEGVRLIAGRGRLVARDRVAVHGRPDGPGGQTERELPAEVILLATGATPRQLDGSPPDGERILTWQQLYDLAGLPERLVVIGSGVTGAEFAGAYQAMGSQVVLVSSRDRVLPGEDADAALVVGEAFRRRGMTIRYRCRAVSVERTRTGVSVRLADGSRVEGSHALLALGSLPTTAELGAAGAGVHLDQAGRVSVDRVSRTTTPGVYAAGDCTGVLPLASVAAMQGRIAMWHALGEEVAPLRLAAVAATVFTDPEIATVGVLDDPEAHVRSLGLATNARAKMGGIGEGFVKLYSRPGAGTVLGGVVVAPRASELILPISVAVRNSLTTAQLANSFAVYPSLSGSLTELARLLVEHD